MITTKQQERDALQQIRMIVADLGEQSYLAAAFDGVFEIAEQNIENDFGLSALVSIKKREQEAADLIIKARKTLQEANEIKQKFQVDRDYWADIRKSLDWAAYQLSDKLGY